MNECFVINVSQTYGVNVTYIIHFVSKYVVSKIVFDISVGLIT